MAGQSPLRSSADRETFAAAGNTDSYSSGVSWCRRALFIGPPTRYLKVCHLLIERVCEFLTRRNHCQVTALLGSGSKPCTRITRWSHCGVARIIPEYGELIYRHGK
jgi:hypothetical protein